MDLLDMLLRKRRRQAEGGITEAISDISKWIIGCGCALVLLVVAGILLLLAGVINFGNQAILVIIVVGMILAAIVSLFRAGLSGG